MFTLKVYNAVGQEVVTLVNEYKNAANYKINFDGSKLSSGVYFYKLDAGNFVQTKKMLLIK
ncbi:MAG: T9SS type A sorting domain-containing protein [Ignavibacteriales bacterium]|nr:T9SS type A sorting domain-containing protein [Ignavibacteriales bacterium]